MANNVGWFFESGVSAEKRLEATPKTTFGGFTESGIQSFDDHFKELQEHYKESTGIEGHQADAFRSSVYGKL